MKYMTNKKENVCVHTEWFISTGYVGNVNLIKLMILILNAALKKILALQINILHMEAVNAYQDCI
jgi:hypothetical protein